MTLREQTPAWRLDDKVREFSIQSLFYCTSGEGTCKQKQEVYLDLANTEERQSEPAGVRLDSEIIDWLVNWLIQIHQDKELNGDQNTEHQSGK